MLAQDLIGEGPWLGISPRRKAAAGILPLAPPGRYLWSAAYGRPTDP
jgi:hypothetical protein